MKSIFFSVCFALFALVFLPACGEADEKTDLVPSGTYTGTISEVEEDEKEIYVKTDDGKTLELYFTDATELSRNGESVAFDTMKEGDKVEVTVEKKGQRLDPLSVKVLQ